MVQVQYLHLASTRFAQSSPSFTIMLKGRTDAILVPNDRVKISTIGYSPRIYIIFL